jgi:auxin-responsive protein IAA
MELELGLAPPNSTANLLGELSGAAGVSASASAARGKRGFCEAFEQEEVETTTLPLFDDGSSSSSSSGSSKRKPALVGWPPVSSARSRACGGGGRHVKVRKEGAAIGRKVDLSLHGCYGDLLATLARMFPAAGGQAGCVGTSGEEVVGDGGCSAGLVVTYEDADGDWMLVGDVPWE